MAKQTLWQKIRSLFRGDEKKSAPKPRQNRDARNETVSSKTSAPSYNRRALFNSLRDKKAEEEEERVKSKAFKATKYEAKDIGESLKKTVKKDVPDPKQKILKERAEKREEEKKKRIEASAPYKKKIDEKYKTRKSGASAYVKTGNYAADPDVAKYNVLRHPVATSATRGAVSGASFGASELAIKKNPWQTEEQRKAEEFYQKNKNAKAEMAGEIVGSLASFGGTAKATDRLGEKVIEKAAPRAAEKLAGTKLIQGAAKKSVAKAVEKGVVKDATKELIEQVGKDKANKIVRAVGTDIVQNATTGLLYDFNKASAEYEIGSSEWLKEMGKSAAFNAAITGAVAGGSMATGGKQLVKDAANTIADRGAKEAAEALQPNYKVELNRRRKTDISLPNENRVAENVADANRQMTIEDEIGNVKNAEAIPNEQYSEPPKPKTAKQKKKAEAAERKMLDEVQRKREANMADTIRKETGGEYSYRQGEHTSTANANIHEARRIEQDQKAVFKRMKEKGVKDLFVDESRPFGMFKTANAEELNKFAGEAAERVRQDPQAVMHRLRDLEQRLAKEADVSPLTSAETVTFKDIADITAIEEMFEAAGETLPKEYAEAFSHIMEWQGTEAGQLLKMRDTFLRQNSASYRQKMITRDIDRWLRKSLGADDAAINDIRRSLDANYGEGYFDKMLTELSKFKGVEQEAAFRKAYADFQKQLIENAKPTGWDIVNTIRHTLMLMSPKTWNNNGLGNINQRIMYDIGDAINIPLEKLAQTINPDVKRTTAILKNGDQLRLANMITSGKAGEANLKNTKYLAGFKDQALADAVNNASVADVADMMDSSKYMGEAIKGFNYKPNSTLGKLQKGLAKGGGYGQKFVSLMLNEPDSWFVERNYRSTLLKYMEANGINSSEMLNSEAGQKIFKEAREYAKDVALENTYKKANELVSFVEALRKKGYVKGSNPLYKAGTIMLDAELPYLKVPVNLIINNFKYSPMGLAKGILVDIPRAISKGDAALLNKATREVSKGLTGTGMMYLGYLMRCRNQADDDSVGFIGNAEDSLKEYGIKDNSFKIGNNVFNTSNLGIGSTQFLMGSALGEDLDKKGVVAPYDVVFDAMAKTLDVEADMSLLENATGLLDLFGNGGDYDIKLSERLGRAGTEIAGDYAGQFIPNPARGVAKAITDADLDTGIKKGDTSPTRKILQRNVNNIVSGVPVLNEKVLPHKVDTHGRLINERKTSKDKGLAILNNTVNPLTHTKVNIPDVDKEELKVKDENGEPYKTKGFDKNRTYSAKVGTGDMAETIDLTGKEREKVARAATRSGLDGMQNLVNKGVFGDRLGTEAQSILSRTPENDEEARALLFSTSAWKNANNERRRQILDWYYGGNTGKGVSRTTKEEAYVGVAGNSEDDFRWQNDISSSYQKKYNDTGLAELGISKGAYVDILEACKDSNHKWNTETQKNQDTINSAKKTKAGILAVDGLTPEQRIAVYQTIRGKRTGFGWNDWDGVSGGGSGYRRRYGGYRHYGGGSRSKKVPALKQSSYKATKRTYKDTAATLKTSSSRSKGLSTASPVKVEPPKVKFKKYEV